MNDFKQSVAAALSLLGSFDSELIGIVWLSLRVSLSASLIALLIGAPLGVLLAISRFRGRQVLVVLANALLGLPPVVVLWAEYADPARTDGLSHLRSMALLMSVGRASLLTAFLAAFGRAIAEVGAIIIVGGNIRGYTRTMTTAIALETSKGDLALALGLGLILISLCVIVSAAAFLLGSWAARH